MLLTAKYYFMQYILTEEEYHDLASKANRSDDAYILYAIYSAIAEQDINYDEQASIIGKLNKELEMGFKNGSYVQILAEWAHKYHIIL